MQINRPISLVICLCASTFVIEARTAETFPKRPKRAEGFLGIHFDFHASDQDVGIGANTTPEMIEDIINLVHPDWIQIDSKGHPGISSYPTKVGYAARGIVADDLPIWRDVTARRGVSLVAHYSGVADDEANETHPDWAAVKADGTLEKRATSLFGRYVDDRLIPQLRELAAYGLDGAWVDGDCRAVRVDYRPAALAEFQLAAGVMEIPKKVGDPHWLEFYAFHRGAYRRYLDHYVRELKKSNPDFALCSNWAFTDHMPEPVTVPVDFLSGDLDPEDSINSARMSARYLTQQGKPWDLMSWSFATKPTRRQKTSVQLEREAAVVIALGGGFEAYFTQNRDGSVRLDEIPVMAEVATFCRARQDLCHYSKPVPQVALLFSTAAQYRMPFSNPFVRSYPRMMGLLEALLASQQSVDVVSEFHLDERISEYRLIIIPEWEYLEPEFKNKLIGYVKSGGNLLLIGPKTASMFQSELGVTLEGATKLAGANYLSHAGTLTSWVGDQQAVTLGSSAMQFGRLHRTNNVNSSSQPAASVTKLGDGKIAATYFTVGLAYRDEPNEEVRRFLNELAHQLFNDPMVEVKGSHNVDVCLARNHGRLLVNLVNTSGPHRSQSIIDSIPALGPLVVTIRQAVRPSRVTLEPSDQKLPFEFRDGKISVVVPRIEIHEAVVITP